MADNKHPNGMKPILIIPPDTISESDLKALNDNGICTIVSKDPSSVRFLDPIPNPSGKSAIESAAIKLSRKLLDRDTFIRNGSWVSLAKDDISRIFVELFVAGTPLDPLPSVTDIQKNAFDVAKLEEVRKIAREEAREEAMAKKAARMAALAEKKK